MSGNDLLVFGEGKADLGGVEAISKGGKVSFSRPLFVRELVIYGAVVERARVDGKREVEAARRGGYSALAINGEASEIELVGLGL